jgi:hypothetical protein
MQLIQNLNSILPDTSTIILHLLREEIRFRKLSTILDRAKIDIDMYAPNVAALTLTLCGFENHSDELLSWYCEKIDHYVDSMNEDSDIKNITFELYIDLLVKSRGERR